jgi:hypothetical protein
LEKTKNWFAGLPFVFGLCSGLLYVRVHKLRTGENIFSDFPALMESAKESQIVDGVANGIRALG